MNKTELRKMAVLEETITRLKGIIARNAMQRLSGEDARCLFITQEDIEESLKILDEYPARIDPVKPKEDGE